MRKTTTVFYNEGDVRKIVLEELKFAKDDWLDEFIGKVTKFKDDVLNGLDGVMGELKAIKEEHTTVSRGRSGHSDQLEDRESRLHRLKKPLLYKKKGLSDL